MSVAFVAVADYSDCVAEELHDHFSVQPFSRWMAGCETHYTHVNVDITELCTFGEDGEVFTDNCDLYLIQDNDNGELWAELVSTELDASRVIGRYQIKNW